eukprot:5482081-Pyramimonas_sp.AAC.1
MICSTRHNRWLTPEEKGLVHNMPMSARDFGFCHFGAQTSFFPSERDVRLSSEKEGLHVEPGWE